MVMEKTTVYLSSELKAQLDRAAAETGRPAAEIVREGIRLAIAQQSPPTPTIPILVSADPHFADQVDDHLPGFGERWSWWIPVACWLRSIPGRPIMLWRRRCSWPNATGATIS
jgi:hypothetical protein